MRFTKIALFTAIVILTTNPAGAQSFRDDDGYGGGYGYWNYHGSWRDHAYSYYIDEYYSPDYVPYPTVNPNFLIYINNGPVPVLTPPPVAPPAPLPQPPSNEFIVNVPNIHGGYTAVVIKRSGTGFTGPQGEFYPQFPTVSQLKTMYGQ